VCSVRLAEEVCVDGHETTLLSLKSYPPGFLKKMVLELGSHLDTIHAVQAGINPVLRIRDPVPFHPLDQGWVKNKNPASGSGKNIPDHIFESLETIF
jgi:hypothetical protein